MPDAEIFVADDQKRELEDGHPASTFYQVTLGLDVLVVIFGYISAFVPWAVKDLAVSQRAWAFPFKTCIENTFSKVNEETCMDNDFIVPQGVPLTGGNASCKAYILTTIAMVFISVLLGAVLIVLLIYMVKCIRQIKVWVAIVAQALLVIVCIAAHLAWIFFLVYTEITCAPNSIFPVYGWSYGFIIYLFISAFTIADVVTGAYGLSKLRKHQVIEKSWKEQEDDVPSFSTYPTYDAAVLPSPVHPNPSPEQTY